MSGRTIGPIILAEECISGNTGIRSSSGSAARASNAPTVRVTLTETTMLTGAKRKTTIKLPCKAVRRAYNGMVASEKRRFLAAAQQMYSLETERGRQKYGDGYMSMKDVWAAHALLASDSSTDRVSYLLDQKPARRRWSWTAG